MTSLKTFLMLALLAAVSVGSLPAQQATGTPDRTVLPIPEPPRPVYTALDARTVEPPPFFQVPAPEGAPNVVIILIDDVGFGAASTFGGPIATPTLEHLAQQKFVAGLTLIGQRLCELLFGDRSLVYQQLAKL